MPKKNNDPEDLPTRESSGAVRNFGWNAKHNDKYSKVGNSARNFLGAHVNQSWDKVYSHICSHHEDKDKKRTCDYIRENLEWLVTLSVREEDGVLINSSDNRPLRIYGSTYYVSGGILRKSSARPKYKRVDKRFKQIDGRNIIQHEGIWYEFTFESFDARSFYITGKCYDYIFKRLIYRDEALSMYGRYIIATGKKQLCSKEIKRLKLNEKEN